MAQGRGHNSSSRGGKTMHSRGYFNNVTGAYRINGVEVAFDPELEYNVKKESEPLFPEYKPPPPTPLTARDKRQIAHFRSVRSAIHEGPYYSVLGDNRRVEKASKRAASTIDPFMGVPTYSQRYTKMRRTLPRLNARPHVLKFFPKELWSTLDPNVAATNGFITNGESRKDKSKRSELKEGADHVHEKAVEAGENAEGAHKEANDDDDNPMEDAVVDDEFEEDDDEGGDYNAEGYFDDGGDDAGDFGGDEGDAGGDYY